MADKNQVLIASDYSAMPVKHRDNGDGSWSPIVSYSNGLLTNNGGVNTRLRVDVGQTSFFAGKEFRTFKELSLAGGASYTIRATVPINIILAGFVVDLLEGSLKIESLTGGTPTGPWSEVLPVFARNTMSERPTPFYTPQVVLDAGGTVASPTVLDVLKLQTSGQGFQAASVGAQSGDERGIGAGTYYIRFTATGTVTAVIRVRWEERP